MNKDPGNNGKRPELTNRKTLLVYAALIVLLVFAIVMNREFFVKMTHELREMSIAGIITVCVCGILYRVIDGVVLCQMGHKYSAEFTLPKAVITALCGSFFRVSTLGSGMAVSKIYYMKRDGIEIGNGMGICFLQTIFFKLSILVMGVVAIVCSTVSRAAFANSKIFVIIDIAANVLLVAAMVTIAVNKRLTEFLFRLGKKICARFPKAMAFLERAGYEVDLLQNESAVTMKDKKLCIILLAESVLMQAIWYITPCIAVIGDGVALTDVFAMIAIANMLAGVIPMPSGFGSVDVFFVLMYVQAGTSVMAALAMVVYRFATTFVPFFAGAPAVFAYIRRERH